MGPSASAAPPSARSSEQPWLRATLAPDFAPRRLLDRPPPGSQLVHGVMLPCRELPAGRRRAEGAPASRSRIPPPLRSCLAERSVGWLAIRGPRGGQERWSTPPQQRLFVRSPAGRNERTLRRLTTRPQRSSITLHLGLILASFLVSFRRLLLVSRVLHIFRCLSSPLFRSSGAGCLASSMLADLPIMLMPCPCRDCLADCHCMHGCCLCLNGISLV